MKNGTALLEGNGEALSEHEAVLVQCPGFRCLAFRDRQGKWRDYFHRGELKGKVKAVDSDPAFMFVALGVLKA